jgi:DNA polymerase-3 subunit epsilon
VVKLTGINNAMLVNAPKFHEVAKRIVEITQNCIVVAHNADFDYRILRTEFRRLGYSFNSKNLCTVALSQKLLPEQPSHSLGKLVRALGIPMADRHRASGDAMATVKLFKILLEKDVQKTIVQEMVRSEIEKGIAPKLRDLMDTLPNKTGVYYIHAESGKVIYIGKSLNIRKRINQHFIGTDKKSEKIQSAAHTVTFEETGSELIALLKESQEIKTTKPVFNRAQRKSIFNIGLYEVQDDNGYFNLKIQKVDSTKREITTFTTIADARDALFRIVSHYKLCQKLTSLDHSKGACFQHGIQECDGACIGFVSPETYNLRVQDFINKNRMENKTIVIVDKGRKISEKSAVLVENGIYRGYAFVDLNYQIHNLEILKNIIVPMQSNKDVTNIIRSFIRKEKYQKLIEL